MSLPSCDQLPRQPRRSCSPAPRTILVPTTKLQPTNSVVHDFDDDASAVSFASTISSSSERSVEEDFNEAEDLRTLAAFAQKFLRERSNTFDDRWDCCGDLGPNSPCPNRRESLRRSLTTSGSRRSSLQKTCKRSSICEELSFQLLQSSEVEETLEASVKSTPEPTSRVISSPADDESTAQDLPFDSAEAVLDRWETSKNTALVQPPVSPRRMLAHNSNNSHTKTWVAADKVCTDFRLVKSDDGFTRKPPLFKTSSSKRSIISLSSATISTVASSRDLATLVGC